ncbi:MAG: hypothetical protein AB7X49_18125 [Geminicoccaceae bacterium]
MPAYCLFDIRDIVDETGLDTYRERVRGIVERFGGRKNLFGGTEQVPAFLGPTGLWPA